MNWGSWSKLLLALRSRHTLYSSARRRNAPPALMHWCLLILVALGCASEDQGDKHRLGEISQAVVTTCGSSAVPSDIKRTQVGYTVWQNRDWFHHGAGEPANASLELEFTEPSGVTGVYVNWLCVRAYLRDSAGNATYLGTSSVTAGTHACGSTTCLRHVSYDVSAVPPGTYEVALAADDQDATFTRATIDVQQGDIQSTSYRHVSYARDIADHFLLPSATPPATSPVSPTLRRANRFVLNVPTQRGAGLKFIVTNPSAPSNPKVNVVVHDPAGQVTKLKAIPSAYPGQLSTSWSLTTLAAGNYEIDVTPEDPSLTYTVSSADVGSPLAFKGGADLAGTGSNLYYYVPAETERALLFGTFDPAGTPTFFGPDNQAVTPQVLSPQLYSIDTRGKPGVWRTSYRTASSRAHFLNLPDLFSFDANQVVASKRIRTALQVTPGSATAVTSPNLKYNNRFSFHVSGSSSPTFVFGSSTSSGTPPHIKVNLLDVDGKDLAGSPMDVTPGAGNRSITSTGLVPGDYELHVTNPSLSNSYSITVPAGIPFVSVDGYGLGDIQLPSYRAFFNVAPGTSSVRFSAKPTSGTTIDVYNALGNLVSGQPVALGNNVYEIQNTTSGTWALNLKGDPWSDIRLLNVPQIIAFNKDLLQPIGDVGSNCTQNAQCNVGQTCCNDVCKVAADCTCQNGAKDGGEWDVDCGPSCANRNCRAPITACATNADCGPGTFCSADALNALGQSGGKVCWNDICQSGLAECGTLDKTCGRCVCHPSCQGKHCGDNLFDGCNDFCAPSCASGEAGCKSDAECPLDHVCMKDVGASFGKPADADVCVPSRCLEPGTSPTDCGHPGDPCGTMCNPAQVSCAGMECGADPTTGASCGSCAEWQACSLDNHCVDPEVGVKIQSRTVSYEVGATPGSYTVGATGRSTYRIPLRLPPAARNLTPDLQLAFSDASHVHGLLGPGWSLAGASQIHRCSSPTKQAFLNIRSQAPLSDELCLDGRPLRRNDAMTAEASDSETTIYKLADDDGTKIVRKADGATTFKVFKPDGKIYSYGSRASERRSVAPFEPSGGLDIEDRTPTDGWYLGEIRDRFGNTATYHYTGTRYGSEPFALERSFHLTHIDYSGHFDGTTASNTYKRRIRFKYREKHDVLAKTGGYVHFVPVDDGQLLEAVTVDTFDGATSHEADRIYKIEYQPIPGNQLERVASIQECSGYDGVEKCLSPTTFEYDDAALDETSGLPTRFGAPATGVIAAHDGILNYVAEGGSKLNQALTLDADGDGLKDILHVNQDLNFLRYWHAKVVAGELQFEGPFDIVGPKVNCVSGATIGDLDGDGRDEIVDGCPVIRHKVHVNYFTIDAVGAVTESESNLQALTSVYLGDIDGNGRPDVIQESDTHVYFADYDGNSPNGSLLFGLLRRVDSKGDPSALSWGKETRQPVQIDVDGDGVRNILHFDSETKQFLALRLAGDSELTSDERAQIRLDTANEPGALAIFEQRIARWMPTGLSYQVSPITGGSSHFDSIRVLDINGDGLDDVWVQSATLIAPFDPNLGRIPDVLTGSEPQVGAEIVKANTLIGQLFPGGLLTGGPSHLWINEGGKFRLKTPIVRELLGHEPTLDECSSRADDGGCLSRLDPWSFRGATVMDYDNDGRDELLFQYVTSAGFEWHRVELREETADRGYLAVGSVPDLPAGGTTGLYLDDIDSSPFTRFQSLGVFSDFNGDGNVDMLLAGHDNIAARRLLVLGTNQGSGRRLRKVTDGLGNTIAIEQNRGAVNRLGSCGESVGGNRSRCLHRVPMVVSEVTRANTTGSDFGLTEYRYERPATADFMRDFYFLARTVHEWSAPFGEGREIVAETREEYGQALENGLDPDKYTYPFLHTPNRRERRLVVNNDIQQVPRVRTITDEFEYEIAALPYGMPRVTESTRKIEENAPLGVDQPGNGPDLVVQRHDVYEADAEGQPLEHEQFVFTGPDSEQVSRTRVYTARDNDVERWILGQVRELEVTSERNDVTLSKLVTFRHDPSTGFVIEKKEERTGDERDLLTTYAPDSFGNVATITESSVDGERVTAVDYGPHGIFPRSTTNAEGQTTTLEFDDVWGAPTLVEDENHFQKVQLYDGFGRPIRAETRNGEEVNVLSETSYSYVNAPYTAAGIDIPAVVRQTTVSDYASGAVTTDLDSRGLPVRGKAPAIALANNQHPYLFTESIYDWAGRQSRRSDPHADGQTPIWTDIEYDGRGRVSSIQSPLGEKKFGYGSAARLREAFPEWTFPDAINFVHVTDEAGKERIVGTDHNGDVVVSADGVDLEGGIAGFVSRTVRGAMDLPITLVDPEQFETETEYDEDGLPLWSEDPNRGRTSSFYDAYGNIKKVLAADDVTSTFEYDRIDRVKSRLDGTGQTSQLSEWSYEPQKGRLTEMVAPTGIRTIFGYEDSPRALGNSVTRQVGTESFKTTITYDTLGRPTRVEYPTVPRPGDDLVFAVEPIFDPHSGALRAVQSDDGETDYWRITDTDNRGRVTEVTLGNGVRETYGFDPTSQLLASMRVLDSANAELSALGYDYYDNGQIYHRNLTSGNVTRSREVTYDGAGRVESVSESGADAQDETFEFSPSGRLTSRTKFGAYTYDLAKPHALASVADNSFTYDARGNQETRTGSQVAGGTQTISYNRFDLPTQVRFGNPDTPDKTVNYEYDAFGDRIVKREAAGSEEVLSIGDEYERTTSGSDVQHKFRVFAAGREVAEVTYDQAASTPAVHYLHRDQQMSVLFTTDADGERSELRDFDIFGEPVTSPTWAERTKEAYTGHHHDTDIGLIDAGARLYDAKFGVFVSADPLRVSGYGSQGFNPYAYANNDPVNLFDPSGLEATSSGGDEDGEIVVDVYGCVSDPGGPGCGGTQVPETTDSQEPVDLTNQPMQTSTVYGEGPGGGDGQGSPPGLPDIPNGNTAPPLSSPNLFAQPTFQVRDTSEFWHNALDAVMFTLGGIEAGLTAAGEYIGTRAMIRAGAEIARSEEAAAANAAVRLARACFVGDTLVATHDGLLPISEVLVGDQVWSLDTTRHEWRWMPVTRVFEHAYEGLLFKVQTTGSEVLVTGNHPFCVMDSGRPNRVRPADIGQDSLECATGARWIQAIDLNVGDVVVGATGGRAITSIVAAPVSVPVYNIQVDGTHTYTAGLSSLLVHNKSSATGPAEAVIAKLPKSLFKPFHCTQCAEAMVEALKAEGIHGQLLKISAKKGPLGQMPDFIGNDLLKFGTGITQNGLHEAVRVGDVVFDNFLRAGVPYNEYANALHALYGVNIVPVPF